MRVRARAYAAFAGVAVAAVANLAAWPGAAVPRSELVTAPGVTEASFGRMPDGADVRVFALTNDRGMEVRVISYGAIVVSLKVPDRDGRLGDVVVGHDGLD